MSLAVLIVVLSVLSVNVAVVFAGQTSSTIFGLNNGVYLNHLSFRNGASATFLNDYVFGSAYQESSANATYANFWFIDGLGVWSNVNLTLNVWFQSGVLNFTANGNGTVELYCPNTPTYMLGGPYNLGTGYNSGSNVWTLPVQNGVCYAAAFTRYWGNFYITEVDSNITALGWTGQVFTVDTQGSGGIFSVYTGSRNAPQAITGLIGYSYNQVTDILTGSYDANGQIVLDWTAAPGSNPTPTPSSSGGPGPGGNPTPTPSTSTSPVPTVTPVPAPSFFSFGGTVNLGSCYPNQTLNEMLNITFSSSSLTINSISFSMPVGGWLGTSQVFPAYYTMGNAKINYVLKVPASAAPSKYSGSVSVSGVDPFGTVVSGSAPYTLTVLGSSTKSTSINPLLIYVFVGIIISLFVSTFAVVLYNKRR
ncbi:MAG: hypothetical protein ABSF44_16235 [Candidatus Bathyarchaeia archaeon]